LNYFGLEKGTQQTCGRLTAHTNRSTGETELILAMEGTDRTTTTDENSGRTTEPKRTKPRKRFSLYY
jgi:hypothetical protein